MTCSKITQQVTVIFSFEQPYLFGCEEGNINWNSSTKFPSLISWCWTLLSSYAMYERRTYTCSNKQVKNLATVSDNKKL